MPKFTLEKTMEISAPAVKISSILSDFRQWPQWSPWLVMEPECKLEYSPDGKSYSWAGKRIGAGNMVKTKESPTQLTYDLNFIKPWKSRSKIWFNLAEAGKKTGITWGMQGSLPFFLFFLKKMMIGLIDMDYQRGLLMLKDLVESGSVPTNLNINGISQFEGCHYVGITTESTTQSIGPDMAENFKKLTEWQKNNGIECSGVPFSIYHKWNFSFGSVRYTVGLPVNKNDINHPPEFVKGEIPATPAFSITHTGPYRHLGNAWSTGYGCSRNKEFKHNKAIPPFELYLNNPGSVDEKEIKTQVFFPAR